MKKTVAILLLLVVALSMLTGCGESKDFNKKYEKYADKTWCTISADGTSMRIDTDPENKAIGMAGTEWEKVSKPAHDAIEQINKDLGFSGSLISTMGSTTKAQGTQTTSNDNYTVSWSFDPDKGLEVTYKVK